jgi:hypothetical protein
VTADSLWTWAAVWATVAALVLYEVTLFLLQRHQPDRHARSRHAALREDWFLAVSAQKGSEVLAVQTLRNSLMSATVLASTAALALMGTVTLAAPNLHASFNAAPSIASIDHRLVLELVLLGLLFASLVSTMMAVRFYNHAGFIAGMPVESDARKRWARAGIRYVRRAGILYGVGLRQLMLVVPVVAALLLPIAGPIAAVLVAGLLFSLDRYGEA